LALLSVSLLLIGTVLGCGDNEKEPILQPPGGTGSLRGVLTFDGQGGPGLPQATVYALSGYDASCQTQFTTIHILGTFNDWDTSLWESTPGMRYLGGCTWTDLLDLPEGTIEWKFVTDKSWDNPPDYVSAGAEGLSGPTQPSPGGNLRAEVLEAGSYHVLLFEATSPPSYLIAKGEDAPVAVSDPSTGAFEIPRLPAGTYEIVIVAEGYLDTHVSGVEIAEGQEVDLGTVNVVSAVGAIKGQVAFADDPDPLPTATVTVFNAGTTTQVAEDSTDAEGRFEIRGLPTGTYDLQIRAPGYVTELVEDVSFTNGEDTDLGVITLQPGCSSEFLVIEVLGDFNNWTSQGGMTQVEPCLWKDTLTVAVTADTGSVYKMKFRTDETWYGDGGPPDYGTCTSEDDVQGLEGEVCPVMGPSGDALAILFPASGDYEFTLDESNLTYRITLLGQVTPGSLRGRVAYEDDPSEPPVTTVRLFVHGAADPSAETNPDTTGVFVFENLVPDVYDVTVEAPGYVETRVDSVTVAPGEETDLGTITLQVEVECTPSAAIEVLGDFNGWQGTDATYLGDCVWADTLHVSVATDPDSTYIMKFRTNHAWDNPRDYGSCQGEGFLFVFEGDEVSGQVCLVQGMGTGIKIKFPASADYRFELDERAMTFRITRLD
jgi:hypothetical protein